MKNWIPALAGFVALALLAAGIGWLAQRDAARPRVAAEVTPPPAALARLARGVNLSTWLQHGRPTEARVYAPDADDWRRIRALGLTHVRLPLDPQALLTDRGMPDEKALGALRAAIDAAAAEDLLVVLAVQLPPAVKAGLATREADRTALGGHWRWLAGALRELPATHLAFEVLNEPEMTDAVASRALMVQLAADVRRAAPNHTIVVAGHGYSGIGELEALIPLEDRNVVYGFHFYEPHNFTHQGADWGDPAWNALRNFPYPSSPKAVAGLLGATHGEARERLRWHGEERWNRERIDARFARAKAWAERHDVPVWCSEFGVFKRHVARADRAAWLRDVRESLEQHGIAWTHWDYAGAFGIVSGPQGKRVADETAIEALGLQR